MNYTVADTITRIKNASLARRREVVIPFSKMSAAITKILVKEGYLKAVKEDTQDGKKVLIATIAYDRRIPMITDVKITSKPSLRVYTAAKQLSARKKLGLGIAVLSTSKGLMTEEQAAKENVGGELLFRIW